MYFKAFYISNNIIPYILFNQNQYLTTKKKIIKIINSFKYTNKNFSERF